MMPAGLTLKGEDYEFSHRMTAAGTKKHQHVNTHTKSTTTTTTTTKQKCMTSHHIAEMNSSQDQTCQVKDSQSQLVMCRLIHFAFNC